MLKMMKLCRRQYSDIGNVNVFIHHELNEATENVLVKQCQVVLTRRVNSSLEGTSTGNQRIESRWGHLRRQCVQSYMNLFHSIQDEGSFTGNYVDINIRLFCFTHILQVRFFFILAILLLS